MTKAERRDQRVGTRLRIKRILPTALIVALAGSYLRLKQAPVVRGIMRGVSLAGVGLLAVLIDLARGAMASPAYGLIGLAAFISTGPLKRNPIAVLLAAGLVGLVLHLLAAA